MRAKRLMIVGMALVAMLTAAWSADMLVSVYVGGKKMSFNPQARVRGGLTYAPLRAAAESVGAHVDWVASTRTANICTDDRCASIKQSQGIMVGNSILIPVRLMSEALGREVKWDPAARAVMIN